MKMKFFIFNGTENLWHINRQPAGNKKIIEAANRKNIPVQLISLFFLYFYLLFLFTGCSRTSPSPPSPTTTAIPPVMTSDRPANPSINPSPSSVEGKNQGEDDTGDDSSGDLDDMYFHIYGETNVSYRDGNPYFDEKKAYAAILNTPGNEWGKMYQDFMIKASMLEREGQFGEAAGFYRKAEFIETRTGKGGAAIRLALRKIRDRMFRKASGLCKAGRYKDAMPYADIAVFCDPSSGETLKLAGIIFSQTGEEGLGISYLSVAVAKLKNDYELQYRLKTLYLLEGMPEMAIPLINENSVRYGRLKSVSEEFAAAYLMQYIQSPSKRSKMTPLIKDSLDKAIVSRSKSKTDTTELKMNLSLFEGKYKEAIKYCDEMLKMDLSYSIKTRLIYDKGLLCHLTGERKKSSQYLNETVNRVLNGKGRSQGENYMAQMSCWFLDIKGESVYTTKRAEKIFARVVNPDHSYQQEYGFIREFLENRERKDYTGAIAALNKYTGKRHLKPVGNFVEDLLQVPAQKSMIYFSKGKMFEAEGDRKKAEECYKEAKETPFGLIVGK